MRAAPVADRPLLLVLEPLLAFRAAIGPVAAIDDDGHVRIVLVVVDHLVVELVGELAGNDAIDHRPLIVGRTPADTSPGPRYKETHAAPAHLVDRSACRRGGGRSGRRRRVARRRPIRRYGRG